jgi:hypothetical protein
MIQDCVEICGRYNIRFHLAEANVLQQLNTLHSTSFDDIIDLIDIG